MAFIEGPTVSGYNISQKEACKIRVAFSFPTTKAIFPMGPFYFSNYWRALILEFSKHIENLIFLGN